MKKHFHIVSLLAIVVLMVACDHGPSETELNNYLAALRPYYPYAIDERFIFVNDSLGKVWEAEPDYHIDNAFPYTDIDKYSYGKGSGQWNVSISCSLQTKDSSTYYNSGKMDTYIDYIAGRHHIIWGINLWLDGRYQDPISGGYILICAENEILSYLTDTILLPIPWRYKTELPIVIAPDEGYARIIKHQGLTDFSIDGKTVWRRVKP